MKRKETAVQKNVRVFKRKIDEIRCISAQCVLAFAKRNENNNGLVAYRTKAFIEIVTLIMKMHYYLYIYYTFFLSTDTMTRTQTLY